MGKRAVDLTLEELAALGGKAASAKDDLTAETPFRR